MIDIFPPSEPGLDLRKIDSDTGKAANVLSVQLGSLNHLPEFGIDLDYFLTEDIEFENESFQAYMIQVLTDNGINVSKSIETVESLYRKYTLSVSSNESNSKLVAR